MNIRPRTILFSTLLLAFTLAPSLASAQPEVEHKKAAIVLHLIERGEGDLAFVDLGAPGPSIGDRLTFSSVILDTNGNRIGRDAAECVIVRIDPTEAPGRQQTVQCSISVQLPDGQITTQGMAQGTENYFAITGGTGAYRQARGEVFARDIVPLVEAEITVWIYR